MNFFYIYFCLKGHKPSITIFNSRALYDYTAEDYAEISIIEGDLVKVITTDDSGWYCGDVYGKTGLFPSNFVMIE